MTQNEIWKDIPGYEGFYQASNLGRIKSLVLYNNRYKKYIKREKVLKTTTQKTGYLMLTLCKDKKKSNLLVHRIIAKTFLSNPNNYPQVNHKDGNKKNNCVDNLEWCTSSENQKHAYRLGLQKVCGGAITNKKRIRCIDLDIEKESLHEMQFLSANRGFY